MAGPEAMMAPERWAIIDLDTLAVHVCPPDEEPIRDHGRYMLYRRKDRLIRVHGATGQETDLGVVLKSGSIHVSAGGSMVAYSPWVIDLSRGTVIGRFTGTPISVSERGAVLVGGTKAEHGLDRGPITWVRPE
jgi:hypothetical protein